MDRLLVNSALGTPPGCSKKFKRCNIEKDLISFDDKPICSNQVYNVF